MRQKAAQNNTFIELKSIFFGRGNSSNNNEIQYKNGLRPKRNALKRNLRFGTYRTFNCFKLTATNCRLFNVPELSLVERVRLDFDTFIEQHRCLWVEKKHHHIIKQEKSIYIKTKATIVSMLLLPLFWPVKICDDFALKSQQQSFSIVLNRKPVWVLHKLTAAATTSIADNNN